MCHLRPGPAGRRSSHVRYAPKATVGHQNAIGRDGPLSDIAPRYSITSLAAMSMVFGTTNPSALAVLRLITSPNLVGA
jgi:hypothetical protein